MKQLKILLLISMITLFTTYANASVNMAPIISYLLSDTEPQGEITINDPALKKVIASAFDNTPYSPAIDIQGGIDAGGLTITVPYTVTNAPATLEAYSTSVILDASVTQDDEAGIVATFAWTEQTNLPVGSGTFTATITIDDSNTSIPDNTYNAKQLDIEDDSAGLVAATFSYATDNMGGTGVLTLKIVSGIPDRMYGQADNTGNTETHKFLYLPVTNTTTGKTWLNNNLGANYANRNSSVYDLAQQATTGTDHNAYGSLFQWGRKADGHELVNWLSGSEGEGVNGTTVDNSDDPTDALFIGEGSDPYDWRVTQDDTLWASESSPNNVCPIGYRVPTGGSDGELDWEKESWGSNDTAGALASTLVMPLPGLRNYTNGTSSYEGENGYYWGSTVSGTEAEYLRISETDAYHSGIFRAYGFSVRCIKISTEEGDAASDAVLAQIGAEGDSGDMVNSSVTVAQLGAILPLLTGIDPANETAYQDYIDANPDLFSAPATQSEVQAMINAVNALNAAPTASDFNLTLDINESTAIGDWKILSSANDSNGDTLSASVVTQGNYGDFVVTGDSLTYLKMTETNATDTGVLEISDGTDTIQIAVGLHSLYWKQVSAKGAYTVALKSDGTLWSWGRNSSGQLGNGTTTDSLVPVQEDTNSTNWNSVSAGSYHTVGLKTDGTLWSWGGNDYGQLGDGNTTDSSVPVQENTAATNWSSVSGGNYHTTALKTDGTLWSWGRNEFGQLGNGTTTDSSVPVQEDTNSTNWSNVSAGYYLTAALKTDGTLWSWGYNYYGQLGDGSTTNSSVPVQEDTEETNWSSVSAGYYHTVSLKTNGTLWSWGNNNVGQLGDGTETDSSVPVQEDTAATNWNSVSARGRFTVALKTDGTLWAWGSGADGKLGNGTTTDSSVPVQEATNSNEWSSVSAGGGHTVALKMEGTLWAWGDNEYGQLGDGTTTHSPVPVQEDTAATNWSSVSGGERHTVGLKTDGTLWSWGRNDRGQLGDGTEIDSPVPLQEDTNSNEWSSVNAGGDHTVALKTDGTLWSWGLNWSGQLADGTTTNSSVPVQEDTAATNWSSVSARDRHTAALKTDGTLWAWGENGGGQLGDVTTIDSSLPVQEATNSTNWKSVSAGGNFTAALKTDGTLWAWGGNGDGQLGNGTTTNSLVPVQEDTNSTNWSSVSTGDGHTAALKTDGTLWAWGDNWGGQLGNGTTTNSLVPVQEDTNSNEWSSVSAGNDHTVALKTDGTLWSWGYGEYGQLGNGTTTDSSVPVQEDTNSNEWSSVSAGGWHTVALKSDGTLWAWGLNGNQQTYPWVTVPTLSQPRQP